MLHVNFLGVDLTVIKGIPLHTVLGYLHYKKYVESGFILRNLNDIHILIPK